MPEMQKCRSIFCRKLATTIKNEYCNPEVAQGEFDIAVMRAGVTTLFVQPVENEVLNDPNQMRKIFTYWVFNYLKQIIRENVIPAVTISQKKKIAGEEIVIEEIKKLLNSQGLENRYVLTHDENHTFIKLDTDHCSSNVMSILNMDDGIIGASKFVDIVKRSGCSINVIPGMIIITRLNDITITVEQRHKENLSITSFEGGDEENDRYRDSLEYRMQTDNRKHNEIERKSVNLREIDDLIPEECRDVYLIMSDPPDIFLMEFGEEARYNYSMIAKFLGLHSSSVKEKLRIIRMTLMQNDIIPQLTKHNMDEERKPTPHDDVSKGYTIGSKWIDNHGIEYVCMDNNANSAQWEIYMDKDAINVVNLVESYSNQI
jgi:hypothetical protein